MRSKSKNGLLMIIVKLANHRRDECLTNAQAYDNGQIVARYSLVTLERSRSKQGRHGCASCGGAYASCGMR